MIDAVAMTRLATNADSFIDFSKVTSTWVAAGSKSTQQPTISYRVHFGGGFASVAPIASSIAPIAPVPR